MELLRTVWATLYPSPKEGWGIANVEAAACGTPSIASDSPGLRETVLDGETVYVLSGDWSLIGWPDFFAEWGYVTWVTSPEELEEYLPPGTSTQRWMGRRLRRVI